MEPVSFTVYGEAAPAGSKTVGFSKDGRHFVRDSSGRAGERWRWAVQQEAGIAMRDRPPFQRGVALSLVVQFNVVRPKSHFGKRGLLPSARAYPTIKPDCSKFVRAVEDAMTGIVYADDAQIVSQCVDKRYADKASCEITVAELQPVPVAEQAPAASQLELVR